MSYGFRRSDRGRILLTLDPVERGLLQSLAAQLIDIIQPPEPSDPLVALVGIDSEVHRPDDPALLRLLPDALTDDPDAALEFRRFTERDLRTIKSERALMVKMAMDALGDEGTVTVEKEVDWLGFLTDVRLVLGTRIGIEEDNREDLGSTPEDDPKFALIQLYDWLSFLQESLVQCLVPDVVDE